MSSYVHLLIHIGRDVAYRYCQSINLRIVSLSCPDFVNELFCIEEIDASRFDSCRSRKPDARNCCFVCGDYLISEYVWEQPICVVSHVDSVTTYYQPSHSVYFKLVVFKLLKCDFYDKEYRYVNYNEGCTPYLFMDHTYRIANFNMLYHFPQLLVKLYSTNFLLVSGFI